MSAETVMVLSVIIAAFVVFGGVLAWAERRTRSTH
jgi:hypothetical protein